MVSSLRSMFVPLTLTILRQAIALIVMCVTSVTAAAARQEDDIPTRVKQGQKVSVTDAQGREFEGRVLDVSADSLTLEMGRGRSDVRRAEILRIDHVDDLKNGAVTGALVGAGLLAVDVLVSREAASIWNRQVTQYLQESTVVWAPLPGPASMRCSAAVETFTAGAGAQG